MKEGEGEDGGGAAGRKREKARIDIEDRGGGGVLVKPDEEHGAEFEPEGLIGLFAEGVEEDSFAFIVALEGIEDFEFGEEDATKAAAVEGWDLA